MKTFMIIEEYTSTMQYVIEAESEEEAREMIESGEVNGEIDTDWGSGTIVHVEDLAETEQ